VESDDSLFLAEAVLINSLHQWFPSAPAKSRLDASALAARPIRGNDSAFDFVRGNATLKHAKNHPGDRFERTDRLGSRRAL
jgi:hypothetical protein